MQKKLSVPLLGLVVLGCVPVESFGLPPDPPPSYEELTTGLGIGILYEPSLGAGPDNNLSDPYTTAYGDEFEKNGFRSVRLRLDMRQFSDNATGTYPNLQLKPVFFADLQAIVDDLLARNNNTMYVLISPKGLESGTHNDELQMASYWGQIANHFKDYTHRLVFNLMNEPYYRLGEFLDMATVESLYQAITDAVRPTNPTRYLVYYKMNDITVQANGTKTENIPYSDSGPGESDFNHMALPANAGTNILFDVHFLGNETVPMGTDKRLVKIRQAYEFREATGYPVWSGAWNWGSWGTLPDNGWDTNELAKVVAEMKKYGIPGTYLMFNSSGTSLYDGNGTDNDNDGIYNEWTKPEYVPVITSRNPVFWQKDAVNAVTAYHPRHDAYTKSNLPDEVNGESSDLEVRNIRNAYLKFNVNRLPAGTVASAKLRLRSMTAPGDTVSVRLASHSNWDERNLSWNTAPSAGSTIASKVVGSAETWYEFDLGAGTIASNGIYTLVLTASGSNLTEFYSRDGDKDPSWSYGPDLIVTVDPSAPSNNVPVFVANPVVEANAATNQAYAGTLADNVSDADGDPLRFGKSTGPAWLTIKQDGSYAGTPGSLDLGLNSWNVEVSDGHGGTAAAELRIFVAAGAANSAPYFTADPIAKAAATANAAYSGSIAGDAVDPDGDPMAFAKTSGPGWLTVSTNGTLSGTPGAGDVGSVPFTVQVSAAGGTDTATLNIAVNASGGVSSGISIVSESAVVSDDNATGNMVFSGIDVQSGDVVAIAASPNKDSTQNLLSLDWSGAEGVDGTSTTIASGDSGDGRACYLFYVRIVNGGSYTFSVIAANSSLTAQSKLFVLRAGPGGAIQVAGTAILGQSTAVPGLSYEFSEPLASGIAIESFAAKNATTLAVDGSYIDDLNGNGRFLLHSTNVSGSAWSKTQSSDAGILNYVGAGAVFSGYVANHYDAWCAANGLSATNSGYATDADGDGLGNLAEYALGGLPANGPEIPPVVPFGALVSAGGTNLVEFVYRRRTDAASRGLDYVVETTTALEGGWSTNGYVELPPGPIEPGFESVTNHMETQTDQRFIRLKIEITQ